MMKLSVNDRKMLVRDLDDWRKLVEYLTWNNKVMKLNNQISKADKFVNKMRIKYGLVDTNEHHTRH